MRFYLFAGLVNGVLTVGSLAWLWVDGLHILPITMLMLSCLSVGLLLGEADE